jgi:hypothetical protein
MKNMERRNKQHQRDNSDRNKRIWGKEEQGESKVTGNEK